MRKMGALFLLASAALCLWGLAALHRIDPVTQWVFPGAQIGEVKAEGGCLHAAGEMPLENDRNQQLDGLLIAVGENYFDHYPLFLRDGRLFYWEEMRTGQPVCLVDEQLALKLYKTQSPIGRTMQLDGHAYRIVGVVKSESRIGVPNAYRAYIPLKQARRDEIPFETLIASARKGQVLELSGGTQYDLPKERTRAVLPLRYVGVLAGILFLWGLAARYVQWLQGRVRGHRQALTVRYAREIWPGIAWTACGGAIGFGGMAVAAFLLLKLAVDPVYQFPEYVPKVLVDWAEISKVFWDNQQASSGAVRLRTAQLLRVEFCAELIRMGSFGLLAGGMLWKKGKRV